MTTLPFASPKACAARLLRSVCLLSLGTITCLPAQAQTLPKLTLSMAVESNKTVPVAISIRSVDDQINVVKEGNLAPGTVALALQKFPYGKYDVYLNAPGYASQWKSFEWTDKEESPSLRASLFRKRYVIVRYAFNASGARTLLGKGIIKGRAAVAHWGTVPYFSADWQVWQDSPEGSQQAAMPSFNFHRNAAGFGFAPLAGGSAGFANAKEAPDPAGLGYKAQNISAAKGLALFCRVNGNQKDGAGYGKLFVEDITDKRPANMPVFEGN